MHVVGHFMGAPLTCCSCPVGVSQPPPTGPPDLRLVPLRSPAQVCKLVASHQQLSNQLEELALLVGQAQHEARKERGLGWELRRWERAAWALGGVALGGCAALVMLRGGRA